MRFQQKVLILWAEANPSTLEKNHLMASGLAESGVKVSVIKLCHTKEESSTFSSLYGNNLKYSIDLGPLGSLYSGKNKFTKLLNNGKLSFSLFWKLFRALHSSYNTTVIIPRDHLEIAIPAVIICKLFNRTLISNIMEYGPALPCFSNFFRRRICWRLVINYSDGYIVISKFLSEKFKTKPTFYLPAVVDSKSSLIMHHDKKTSGQTKFNINISEDVPILIYTSSSAYRELLEFCIKSLALIKDKRFLFVITGRYSDLEKQLWLKKIKRLGLEGRVKFTGLLEENKLVSLQRESRALLIPLLNTTRHIARFPQKILKYVSLKKPTVSTKVGEIGFYFEDNVTAFLDETVSTYGYAAKVRYVLSNEHDAYKVGENAQKLVQNKFDYLYWGEKLREFIAELKKV